MSIFRGLSFGQCYFFSSLKYVEALKVILGGIPVPEMEKPSFDILCQCEPDKFLEPYEINLSSNNDLPDHVIDLPIITVTQLQVNSLIRTVSAGMVVLPLLFLLDNLIKKTLKDYNSNSNGKANIKALVIEATDWSDYALILRTNNIDFASQIAGITVTDLMNTWDKLINEIESSNNLKENLLSQKKAFERRFKRLWNRMLLDDLHYNINEIYDSRFFSTSISTPGILWPCVHLGLQSMLNKFEVDKNQRKYPKEGTKYDHIKIKITISISNCVRRNDILL